MSSKKPPLTYAQAGVSIDAGDAFVDAIKPLAAQTQRAGVMQGLGGFGALFDPKQTGYRDPIFVSGTDGVGTKLLGGIESGMLDGLGQDLVAMCVNDLLCQGAEPMVFLDYFATGVLDPAVAERVVASIARACADSGCALVGGETAEMPQLYAKGHFDLAGFAMGMVERDQLLPNQSAMAAGDTLVAWTSSGVHANGFSLIRRVLAQECLGWHDPAPWSPHKSVAESLMVPTRLYVSECLALRGVALGFAHITGGGLPGNVNRMLPKHLAAHIDINAWDWPAFFRWVIDQGLVDQAEAFRAFNMGLGMVAVLPAHARLPVPEGAVVIGRLVARQDDQEQVHLSS